MDALAQRGGLVLGGLLVLAGIAETVRAVTSGDGGVAFWFGSLVGGGACVVASTLWRHRAPGAAMALLVLGEAPAAVATAWTVVVPLLLLGLLMVRVAVLPSPAPGQSGSRAKTTRR